MRRPVGRSLEARSWDSSIKNKRHTCYNVHNKGPKLLFCFCNVEFGGSVSSIIINFC